MAKAGLMLEKNIEDLDAFKRNELTSHRELYEILRQGNAEQSRQAMIDHIANSEQLILHAFDNALQEPSPGD
jgi:DNA-binding FadR family transcriptional regulator